MRKGRFKGIATICYRCIATRFTSRSANSSHRGQRGRRRLSRGRQLQQAIAGQATPTSIQLRLLRRRGIVNCMSARPRHLITAFRLYGIAIDLAAVPLDLAAGIPLLLDLAVSLSRLQPFGLLYSCVGNRSSLVICSANSNSALLARSR